MISFPLSIHRFVCAEQIMKYLVHTLVLVITLCSFGQDNGRDTGANITVPLSASLNESRERV